MSARGERFPLDDPKRSLRPTLPEQISRSIIVEHIPLFDQANVGAHTTLMQAVVQLLGIKERTVVTTRATTAGARRIGEAAAIVVRAGVLGVSHRAHGLSDPPRFHRLHRYRPCTRGAQGPSLLHHVKLHCPSTRFCARSFDAPIAGPDGASGVGGPIISGADDRETDALGAQCVWAAQQSAKVCPALIGIAQNCVRFPEKGHTKHAQRVGPALVKVIYQHG